MREKPHHGFPNFPLQKNSFEFNSFEAIYGFEEW